MIVIIDLNYLPFHTFEELKSLSLQILQSYSLLRKKGYKLVLSVSQRVSYLDYLIKRIENTKIYLIEGNLRYSLRLFNILRPVFLDPYSPKVLKEGELYYFDGIIIGGIVDKTPKKGLTTNLIQMDLPYVESRKIELRGSRLGVPSTVNGIIDLITKVLEFNSLESAIRSVQSKRDARIRAIHEINKIKSSDCYEIFEVLKGLKEWLNIDENDFPKILAKSKYKICLKLIMGKSSNKF